MSGAHTSCYRDKTSMFEATNIIFAGSRHTAGEIPDACRDRVIYLPENGIESSRFHPVEKEKTPHPVRACFVGRLVPYKGPDMLLEAAAPLLADGRLTLDIVGDGPMMSELKAFVARARFRFGRHLPRLGDA